MLEFTRARDARILAASTTPCMSLSKNVSDYYQNIWHEPSPYTSIQRLPDYNTERTKVGNICGPLTTHGSHNQPLEEPPATPGNERKFPKEIMASTRVLRSSRRNEIFKSCSKKTQHDKSLNGSGFNHVRSCVFDENILSPSRELLNHKRFRTTTASQSQSRKTRLQQNRSKPPCNGSRKRNASENVIGKEQRIKSHVCSVCSKRFISPSQLNRHYRTHTGEKPYRCDVCKKTFSQEKSLKYHTELHTGGNRYICGICKRSLSSSSNLTGHMSIHTGERPYTCEICQKKFRRNQFLTQHMITHTGERPYSCDVCEKKFARKITVTYHMRTHVSKKRDEVNDQEKLPKRPDMTKFSGVDKGEKPYECSFCEAKFSRQSKLTTHLRKHTG
ncbi:hypothetical protein JCM33374_g338 [Metschnikowia sp. JCM 33374]|nr:hypothetical protein JCM33374_g338 [Metschnikowia sp. JCM 33374]